MRHVYLSVLYGTLLLLIPALSIAQNLLVINQLDVEPLLDGDLFEPAWTDVKAYSMVMMYPESGIPPSQKTEFKIGEKETETNRTRDKGIVGKKYIFSSRIFHAKHGEL